MTVPVRGTIRPNRQGTFTEKHAAEIGERLIALEKAVGGATGGATFVSPAVPAFGGGAGGAPGAPGAPGVPGAPGASDHGVLTGLADDDHPQYATDGYPAQLGVASWAQYFLKWIVSHPAVTCAIPGTGRPEHMADNLKAGFGPLPDAAQRRAMSQYYDAL